MDLLSPNDHIVTSISDRYFIVDTGSPVSFNYEGIESLEIENRAFSISRMPVCPKEDLDRLTGISIAGIIGTDIVRKTGLTIDLETRTLDFSVKNEGIDPNDYALLSFEFFMGNYLVTDDVFLGRQLHKVIIDTGACIPYISKRLSSLFEHTGEMYHDISPSFGVLQGEYLKGDLTCKSPTQMSSRSIKMGMMPEVLDMFGLFDAILGVTAITDKRIIFDFSRKVLLAKM